MQQQKFTILLVESSLLFKALIDKALKSMDSYQVITAKDEIDAILQLSRVKTTLVIVGHNLSYGATLKLITHMRNTSEFSAVPVLKISSNIKQKDFLNLVKLGINDIITLNDIDLSTLVKRIGLLLKDQDLIYFPKTQVVSQKKKVVIPDKISSIDISQFVKQSEKLIKPSCHQLITPQLLEKKLMKIAGVKTVSFIISELLALTSNVNTEISDLVNLIKTDHALTAKVLKLANSICYNRMSSRIYNLKDAIKSIGFNGVKDLAIGLGTIDTFKQESEDVTFNRVGLWHYSFTTAIIAREIAYLTKYSLPETAFVSSLLNCIGLAILDDHFEEEFKSVLEYSICNSEPLVEVEKQCLGLTHNEISSKLLRHWKFHENVIMPISLSHLSFSRIMNLDANYERYKKNIIFIKVAEYFTKILSGGLIKSEIIEEIPEEIFTVDYLNCSQEDLFNNIFEIEKTANEIITVTLKHVDPEVMVQSNLFSQYKAYKLLKIMLVSDITVNSLVLETMFKKQGCEVFYVNSDIEAFLSEEAPDVVVFDIDRRNKSAYNCDFLTDLISKTSIKVIITSTNDLLSLYQNKIGQNNQVIYLKRPLLIGDLCYMFDRIYNK